MNSQVYLIIAASLVLILTWSGVMTRSRRGQRMVRLLGEMGTRIFYTVIAVGIIILSFFIN